VKGIARIFFALCCLAALTGWTGPAAVSGQEKDESATPQEGAGDDREDPLGVTPLPSDPIERTMTPPGTEEKKEKPIGYNEMMKLKAESIRGMPVAQLVLEKVKAKAENDWDYQYLILQELWRHGMSHVVEELIRLSRSDNEMQVAVCAELFGYFGDKASLPRLKEIMLNPAHSYESRKMAVVSFSRVGTAADIPEIAKVFEAEDPKLRMVAVEGMDRLGRAEAAPYILDLYRRENDQNVKISCLYALINFQTPESIALILSALKDNDPRVRENAATVLLRVKDNAEVTAAVNEALLDKSKEVRVAAARTLFEIGDKTSIPNLAKAMREAPDDYKGTDNLKEIAVELLGHLKAPEGIPHLVEAMTSTNTIVSAQAAFSLGLIKVPEAVPPLKEALNNHPDNATRANAAMALGEIGTPEAIEALIEAADAKDSKVRYNIENALSATDDRRAVETLVAMAREGGPQSRSNAVSLLGSAAEFKDLVTPVLLEIAGDETGSLMLRVAAARALGNLKAEEAIPVLKNLQESPIPQLRGASTIALGQYKDPALTPDITRMLKDQNTQVVSATIQVIEGLGDPAAAPALVESLEYLQDDMVFSVLLALGTVPHKGSLPALYPYLKDDNWQKRLASLFSIEKIGDDSSLPYVIACLKDESEDVRLSASDTLGAIGAEAAIPALREILEEGDTQWVEDIVRVNLGRLGDEELFKQLEKEMQDENPEVRYVAQLTLGEIGNKRAVRMLVENLDDDEDLGLVISTIGLVPGDVPYYQGGEAAPPQVRDYAVTALKKIVEEDYLGYNLWGSESDREADIQKWYAWWDENEADYLEEEEDFDIILDIEVAPEEEEETPEN
jgi:HEAT repeat protein